MKVYRSTRKTKPLACACVRRSENVLLADGGVTRRRSPVPSNARPDTRGVFGRRSTTWLGVATTTKTTREPRASWRTVFESSTIILNYDYDNTYLLNNTKFTYIHAYNNVLCNYLGVTKEEEDEKDKRTTTTTTEETKQFVQIRSNGNMCNYSYSSVSTGVEWRGCVGAATAFRMWRGAAGGRGRVRERCGAEELGGS